MTQVPLRSRTDPTPTLASQEEHGLRSHLALICSQATKRIRVSIGNDVLKAIKQIKSVGRFSETAGSNLPLDRLTLVFAENGRGKSTLAAILRSLGSGDSDSIVERRRIGSEEEPRAVVATAENEVAIFKEGSWTTSLPDIRVFDDQFVEDHVHSGLSVDSGHRKNLHNWILGANGANLNHQLEQLNASTVKLNAELRLIEEQMPESILDGMSFGNFCMLEPLADVESIVGSLETRLTALSDRENIAESPTLEPVALAEPSRTALEDLLGKSLKTVDEAALQQVSDHFSRLGSGGEQWVSEGVSIVDASQSGSSAACPFCDQSLKDSELLLHYRAYFDERYRGLLAAIDTATHDHDSKLRSGSLSNFERQVRVAVERRDKWAAFGTVPTLSLDTGPIAARWTALHTAIEEELRAKKGNPLESLTLSSGTLIRFQEFDDSRAQIQKFNGELSSINDQVQSIKDQAKDRDIEAVKTELRDAKRRQDRFLPHVTKACADYLGRQSEKTTAEKKRVQVRKLFQEERRQAFDFYGQALNEYLSLFFAEFRVRDLEFTNPGGVSSSSFGLDVNGTSVPLTASESRQSSDNQADFRNTLSSGDRRTLALAMYFAGAEREAKDRQLILVIDDPSASLDAHRSTSTAQVIVALAKQVDQVIVLSHSKEFLGQVFRVNEQLPCSQLQIRDRGGSSILAPWDVQAALRDMHDRRHERFEAYLGGADDDVLALAQCIRPHLEVFLSIVVPADFEPNKMLGTFIEKCEQRLLADKPIVDESRLEQLRRINQYSRQFHHDGTGIQSAPAIHETELQGYIRDTLEFARL